MALSRGKIYVLGTLAVIIAAACITIPLVLNQKSHSSNPNNATRALATTIAEALATASLPASSQAATTTTQPDSPKTNPVEESADTDKEDSAGDQTEKAPQEVPPVNSEVPKHSEQPTRTMPEATQPMQPTQPTHELPQAENAASTHDIPGATNEEPQHPPSTLNHPNPTQPDQLHDTQPTVMETQHPENRQPEHDNINGPVSPQVQPAAESPAPLTRDFPNPEHLPMTTGAV